MSSANTGTWDLVVIYVVCLGTQHSCYTHTPTRWATLSCLECCRGGWQGKRFYRRRGWNRLLWIAGMGKSRVEEQQIRVKMPNYILLVREQLRPRIDIVRIDHKMVYLSCYNNLNDNLNMIANSTECREQTLYNYQVRVSFKDDHMHFYH